jgi:hypothetical protein
MDEVAVPGWLVVVVGVMAAVVVPLLRAVDVKLRDVVRSADVVCTFVAVGSGSRDRASPKVKSWLKSPEWHEAISRTLLDTVTHESS